MTQTASYAKDEVVANRAIGYTRALATGDIAPPNYEQRQGMGIAGGAPGINAALEWNPRAGYTVIVLANYDPPSAERVAKSIRGLLPKAGRR